MAYRITDLRQLKDHLGFTLLSAGTSFSVVGPFTEDHVANLRIAFDLLVQALPLAERAISRPAERERLRPLLAGSLAAYEASNNKEGARLLQDFRALVFPARSRG